MFWKFCSNFLSRWFFIRFCLFFVFNLYTWRLSYTEDLLCIIWAESPIGISRCCAVSYFFWRLFLSLRHTGVETSEWVSQKFKRRLQFFNLVSDFFGKWNFSKKRVLIIGIRVLIYLHLWHKNQQKLFFYYGNLIW